MRRPAARFIVRFGVVAVALLLATFAAGGEEPDQAPPEAPPIDHGDVAVTPIRPEMDLPPTPSLARIIHESFTALQNVFMEKPLRLSCPKHRANQPPRASVRFSPHPREPWASAQCHLR